MVYKGVALFFLNFLFLSFDLLLFLDLVHVVFALNTGLFGKSRLLFSKLAVSCNFEVGLDSLSLDLLESFSFSGLSITLFESSLGSEGVDFSLSISSLFLELSQALDLTLLLLLDSLLLKLGLVLSLVACLLISYDLLLLFLLLSDSLFLLESSLSVSFSSLAHEHVDSLSLGLSSVSVLLLHLFDIVQQLLSLLVADFLLLHPLKGSFLDLVDNHLLSAKTLLNLQGLAFFFDFEHLESLNLHHEVEFLLLFNPLLLETLILLKLLVSDGNDLGVEHHLVHVLDIVKVFIHAFLSLAQQRLRLILFFNLPLSWCNLLSSCGIHLHHFGLSHF